MFCQKGFFRNSFFWFFLFSLLFFIFIFFFPSFSFKNSLNLSSFKEGGSNLFLVAKDDSLKKTVDFVFLSKNSLFNLPSSSFFTFQSLAVLTEEETSREIKEYTVQEGDSLSSISQKFNISLNTLLWANNLKKNSPLKVGQKLIILPVSGLVHEVKAGDTLSQISQKYQAKIEEILTFNELSDANDIYIGDLLIIPNGILPPQEKKSSPAQIPLASNYFLCPLNSCQNITQGLHWFNAVDFKAQCGDPVFAPAQGKVLKVKLTNSRSVRAFGGAGNHLTLLHPNGVVTFYGHLLTALVKPGQKVSQGEMIALVGGQPNSPGAGRSTGCHLHFGVQGAKNPFAK